MPVHLQTEEAVEDGTEFDPNRYFEVFNRLSMEPGYTLDYVYTYDGMGGYPTLFTRKVDAQPFLSWNDVPTGMDDYRDPILVEDSAENLKTAKRLGMRTVWISRATRAPAWVDLRLKSVLELPRRLGALG